MGLMKKRVFCYILIIIFLFSTVSYLSIRNIHAKEIIDGGNFEPQFNYGSINQISFWTESLGNIDNILVHNDIAFVSGGHNTLVIFNISDRMNIKRIGSYDSGSYYTLCLTLIDNNTLIISYGSNGLEIIDISDLTNPVLISALQTIYVGSMVLNGNYLYTTDYFYDIKVIDLSNIESPSLVAEIRTEDIRGYDLYLDDDLLYAASGSDGLEVYNLTNPAEPVFQSNYTIDGISFFDIELDIDTEIVYLLGGLNKIIVLNASDISNISYVSNFTGNDFDEFFFENEILYTVGEYSDLELYNCSDCTNVTKITSYHNCFSTSNVFVESDFIYLLDEQYGLIILKWEMGTNLVYLDRYGDLLSKDLYVFENYAYVISEDDNIIILNLSDIYNPTKVAMIYSNNKVVSSLDVVGTNLYVTYDNCGLFIYNISNIQAPLFMSHFFDGGNSTKVVVKNNRAYLADGEDGLEIIDLTDISHPVEIANTTSIFAMDIILDASSSYSIIRNVTNDIIFVSNFETIDYSIGEIVGVYSNSHDITDMKIINKNLVIIRGTAQIINIDSIENPYYVETYSEISSTLKMCIWDDLLAIFHTSYSLMLTNTLTTDYLFIRSYSVAFGDLIAVERHGVNLCILSDREFNIIELDSDKDELNDYLELRVYNTDITTSDTDSDGLIDGTEIELGTNPLYPDSDFDTLSDGDEYYIYGTDPTRKDTDGDGFSDAEELEEGTDPLDPTSYPFTSYWKLYISVIGAFLLIATFLIFRIRKRL